MSDLVENIKTAIREANKVPALEQRIADLERQVKHWKSNHETEVARARILKERPDMPIERVTAYEQIGDLQRQLAEARKDAERYRWLKENIMEWKPPGYDGCKYGRYDGWWKNEQRDLDQAIDAAIGKP